MSIKRYEMTASGHERWDPKTHDSLIRKDGFGRYTWQLCRSGRVVQDGSEATYREALTALNDARSRDAKKIAMARVDLLDRPIGQNA